jgi:hypothetical protein
VLVKYDRIRLIGHFPAPGQQPPEHIRLVPSGKARPRAEYRIEPSCLTYGFGAQGKPTANAEFHGPRYERNPPSPEKPAVISRK